MMSVADSALLPGAVLGGYELLSIVARGGMGEVWLARDTGGTADVVALKTMLPATGRDEKARRMFLDEGRIAARLRHPNVAQVLARGEQDGTLFYVMEWVDGASLDALAASARAAGQRVPIPVLLRIVRDAARGLHAAHELRDESGQLLDVIHRDVSPQNLLVRRDGVVKVTDFGIARARDRLARTTTGSFRGKLRYVAPEQALGEPLDRRADVWSLGVVLYEGLAGENPFDSPQNAAILTQVLRASPPFVFPADVPLELARVLRRALARHPQARFSTAEELACELDAIAARTGLDATPADVAAEIGQRLGHELEARQARLVSGPRPVATPVAPLDEEEPAAAESVVRPASGVRLRDEPAAAVVLPARMMWWVALAVLAVIAGFVVGRRRGAEERARRGAPAMAAPTAPSSLSSSSMATPSAGPPTSAVPTAVVPTAVAPTAVAPTAVAPTAVAPTAVAPTPAAPLVPTPPRSDRRASPPSPAASGRRPGFRADDDPGF